MTMMMTIKKDDKLKCAHCEEELGQKHIHEADTGLGFCCDGCRAVYHLIGDEGFSSFYSKRLNWQPGAVERVEADDEYFNDSVKDIDKGLKELSVAISGIRCAACIWLIETSISKDERIKSIRVNYANHKAKVIFNPEKITLSEVLERFTRLGYCPLPDSASLSENDRERKDYFYRFVTAAFFSMQLMVYSTALYAGYFEGIDESFKIFFQLISWALATPVIFYSAMPFFKKAYLSIRQRYFTMDTLVAIGAGSAYLYSIFAIFLNHETYFDTAAMIVTLILLGRFIEAGAKQRGGDTVNRLLSLKPKKVKIINSLGEIVTVPLEQLHAGDYFQTDTGDNIAADGVVSNGTADIDESMLSGEPLPVSKSAGAMVFAGTKNIGGNIMIKAEKVGSETFLAKIATSVEEAQCSKAPIQDVADRFIGYFVPFVIFAATGTFIFLITYGEMSVADCLMRAVSVLVVACPCAMGLATPLAIITASAKLSASGVIFKGGESIERFAAVNDFYFDKTGTITKGEMKVSDYVLKEECDIGIISSLAARSRHPASKAVSIIGNGNLDITDIKEIAGKGIKGYFSGKEAVIGSSSFMADCGVIIDKSAMILAGTWINKGYTIVFSGIGGFLAGIFAVSDIIRAESKDVIDKLINSGAKVTILTGDNIHAAENILHGAGITAPIHAGVSPFDKSEIIRKSIDPSKTVMIGDGINDAIALTSAAVGISLRSGTDISLESSSAVLLRNDLGLIVTSKEICRKSLKIIKENLFWAFSYNIIAIPLAMTGYIHPVMSAAFMSISSLLVVANSSRIRRY